MYIYMYVCMYVYIAAIFEENVEILKVDMDMTSNSYKKPHDEILLHL